MKNTISSTVLCAFILFLSCNKNEITDYLNLRQLKSETITNSGDAIVKSYQYDTQNRLTKEKSIFNSNASNASTFEYNYISPTLIVSTDNVNGIIDSLFLNDAGLVYKILSKSKNSALPDKYIYEYDADNRLKKYSSYSGTTGEYKLIGTTENVYDNSKLISSTEISSTIVNGEPHEFTHTVTYEYAIDVLNTIGNKQKGQIFKGLESDFLPTKKIIQHKDKLISTGQLVQSYTAEEFYEYILQKAGYVSQINIKKSNILIVRNL